MCGKGPGREDSGYKGASVYTPRLYLGNRSTFCMAGVLGVSWYFAYLFTVIVLCGGGR